MNSDTTIFRRGIYIVTFTAHFMGVTDDDEYDWHETVLVHANSTTEATEVVKNKYKQAKLKCNKVEELLLPLVCSSNPHNDMFKYISIYLNPMCGNGNKRLILKTIVGAKNTAQLLERLTDMLSIPQYKLNLACTSTNMKIKMTPFRRIINPKITDDNEI